MKNCLSFLSLLFVAIYFLSCKPNPSDAVAYNNLIVNQQVAIIGKIDALNNTYAKYIPSEMDKSYKLVISQVINSTDSVKKMSNFDRNSSLKDAALKLFAVYKSSIENEHSEMIRLYKLYVENKLSDEDTKKVEKLYIEAKKKMDAELENFKKVQQEFADEYKFKLQ